MTPKMMLPWVIIWPKAKMTLPASPPKPRMRRVVDTFNPNRNSVVMSSRDGKMENSRASEMVMVIIKIRMDNEILTTSSTSRRLLGSGMMRNRTMTTTRRAMLFSKNRLMP